MTYLKDRVLHAIKVFTAVIVVAVLLAVPVGEAFAAGLLKQGSSGAEVTQLQQELMNRGYFTYWRTTGYFGTKTKQSVINFQKAAGLTPDGIVGPKTHAALFTNTANRSAISQKERDDIYWLAKIINAESQGEPYTGQVAVGSVIMNRVKSASFPNTVYGVIFEYYQGIPQFSPVADGTIYNTPNQSSMNAAAEAYAGNKPVGNALYFFNPAKAAGSWIVQTRKYITTIGHHAFYQ